MTTLGGIAISGSIVIATAIVAWILKPIFDKKNSLVNREIEKEFPMTIQGAHHIVIDNDTSKEEEPEDAQTSISLSEPDTLEEAGVIQETLKAESSEKPKRSSKKHSDKVKKTPAADTQNKPKRGRPKKTNKNEG
jgi:hypothetical protein